MNYFTIADDHHQPSPINIITTINISVIYPITNHPSPSSSWLCIIIHTDSDNNELCHPSSSSSPPILFVNRPHFQHQRIQLSRHYCPCGNLFKKNSKRNYEIGGWQIIFTLIIMINFQKDYFFFYFFLLFYFIVDFLFF